MVCFFVFNLIDSIESSKSLFRGGSEGDIDLEGSILFVEGRGGFASSSDVNSRIRFSKSLMREFLEVSSVLNAFGSNSGGGPSIERSCSINSLWSDLKVGRTISEVWGVAPSSNVSFCFSVILLVSPQSVAKNASPV